MMQNLTTVLHLDTRRNTMSITSHHSSPRQSPLPNHNVNVSIFSHTTHTQVSSRSSSVKSVSSGFDLTSTAYLTSLSTTVFHHIYIHKGQRKLRPHNWSIKSHRSLNTQSNTSYIIIDTQEVTKHPLSSNF